ncbi:MAG: DEAD/DEAH box helicase [Lentisphaeria bacterium]|nr:DEAD/DEAH box helicase [Lentisphaeria bacterium]
MCALNIQCPPQAPPWLENWFSDAELIGKFKPGLRNAANRALAQPGKSFVLHWEADLLSSRMDSFSCSWRFSEGQWRPSCHCNFPDDYCLHAFAAGLLLREACRQKGWPHPSLGAARQPSSLTPARAVSCKVQPELDFGADMKASGTERQRLQLEVEADFRHEPGKVGLRFYAKSEGMRQLLRLGQLREHAIYLKQERPSADWPEQDQRFLLWLQQHLPAMKSSTHKLLMLVISEESFLQWRRRWCELPGRFLERHSQQAIAAPGQTVPTKLIFELQKQGQRYRITPYFVFPDGKRRQPYQLLRELENDPGRILTRELLHDYKPPVSWAQLNRHFSSKPLLFSAAELLEAAPELLQGRLDLLQGEPLETRRQQSIMPGLQADYQAGKFVLSCYFAGKNLPLRGEWAPQSRLQSLPGGAFRLHIFEPTKEALSFRQSLLEFGQAQRAELQQERLLFSANAKNALSLREFFHSLPATLEKRHAAALQALLHGEGLEPVLQLELSERAGLCELQPQLELGGKRIALDELRRLWRDKQSAWHSSSGDWLYVAPQRLEQLFAKLEQQGFQDFSAQTMLRGQSAAKLDSLLQQDGIQLNEASRAFYEQLCREPQKEIPALPEELLALLRKYQRQGFDFLMDRCLNGAGCILADDMGLGKTLQALAVLLSAKNRAEQRGEGFLALVVCPASVMQVWQEQGEKFCPGLRLRIFAGSKMQREEIFAAADYDVLVTHYALLRQDKELLQSRNYDFIVLDEAQNIKNPEAQASQAVKNLKARHKIALTGTPLENKILDLWSIMDFLNPGYYPDREEFVTRYSAAPGALRQSLSLLMLRRGKELVAPELPPRVVQLLPVEMPEAQRDYYDAALLQARAQLEGAGAIQILAALTRLRQICCDPALLSDDFAGQDSGKLALLLEKLQELNESGHSVLVFSQFTRMLDLIARRLSQLGLPYWQITGETPLSRRGELVQEFNHSEQAGVFLLSLKAAGTGLTLTKADYVFLYDPWWNPAVENQAIDRAHRIGQDKTVMAYRLLAKDSIEERVIELMQEKQELFEAVVGSQSEAGLTAKLTRKDLEQLLR